MNVTAQDPEKKKTIESEITPLAIRTATLSVSSQEDRANLAEEVKSAEDLKKRIEEKFHPTANRKLADEQRDAARDTEKQFYDPIDAFIKKAKEVVKLFDTKESQRIERERREVKEKEDQKAAEDKAQREAEAAAAADAEEKRILDEAQRLEDERKKKLELQQSATESGNSKVAGLAAKEVARIDNKIADVIEAGQQKIADIHRKAEEIPTPPIRFNTPAPAVAPKKLVWKARVTNMQKLCMAIGGGAVPFSVVEVRVSAMNDFAKGYDGSSQILGLEFYQESTGRL